MDNRQVKVEVKKLKLADLHPTKKNPRKITPEDLDRLKGKLRDFPSMMDVREIVVDENLRILGGHQRVKALLADGETEATVKIVTGWTDDEKDKFIIRDNVSDGDWDEDIIDSDWDKDVLRDEGVPITDDEEEIEKEIEEPETPEVEDGPTICQPGDIWQLGEHRLMCGDSTKPEDVERLMAGETADLWLTDPPYNVDYEGGTGLKIQNDKMEDSAFRTFLNEAFFAAKNVLKDGGAFYIWHADSEGYNFRGACQDNDLKVRECLVWNKSSLVLGRQDYQWKHEPCLYGWKDGAPHYFINDRSLTTIIEDTADIDKMSKTELKTALKNMLNGGVPTTVIDCEKPSRSEDHPTMKPVKLFAYLMRNSSRERERVLDTFAGSGTTIMAAEQLGRKAYCMELDPHYCDVIIKRWEAFTGRKAERVE